MDGDSNASLALTKGAAFYPGRVLPGCNVIVCRQPFYYVIGASSF
jgi:hypothetical protein